MLAGAGIGAAVGFVATLARGGDLKEVAAAAASGAVAGAIIAAFPAAAVGLAASEGLILGGVVGNMAGGTLTRTILGRETTTQDLAVDGVVGAGGAILGNGLSRAFSPAASASSYAQIPLMSADDLPTSARKLLSEYRANGWQRAESGPTGRVHSWKNAGSELPSKGRVYDAQYDINGRGTERFVRTEDGNVYYTNDHYSSFSRVIEE